MWTTAGECTEHGCNLDLNHLVRDRPSRQCHAHEELVAVQQRQLFGRPAKIWSGRSESVAFMGSGLHSDNRLCPQQVHSRRPDTSVEAPQHHGRAVAGDLLA